MPKQMAIPFSVGPDGGVDFVTDPIQALGDRVRALTATSPGERAMRATFGVSTGDVLFSWDANIGQMQLEQRVKDAVTQWEPSARVLTVQPTLTADGAQVIGVNVDISAGDPVMVSDAAAQYTVTITSTGEVARTA